MYHHFSHSMFPHTPVVSLCVPSDGGAFAVLLLLHQLFLLRPDTDTDVLIYLTLVFRQLCSLILNVPAPLCFRPGAPSPGPPGSCSLCDGAPRSPARNLDGAGGGKFPPFSEFKCRSFEACFFSLDLLSSVVKSVSGTVLFLQSYLPHSFSSSES